MSTVTALRTWRWNAVKHLDYHVGEAIRFAWFQRRVVPLITGNAARVLDAGSGGGRHAFYLARRFPHVQVWGIDTRADVVEQTRARAEEEGLANLHFEVADLTHPLPGGPFDLIYSFDVLEHVADDRAALAHMAAALGPGGWLAVHTPLTPQEHWLRRFDLDHLPNPLHAREGYRRGELEEKAAESGLTVTESVYTHGRWGTLAWDLWKWSRFRLVPTLALQPFIRFLVAMDVQQTHRDGNCVLVLARKDKPDTGLK